MKLGEVRNPEVLQYGKPLEGVRILAAEQMQALPFATQLLARLGAEVVKVEHPEGGESGRGAMPALEDGEGHSIGSVALRNGLNKKSVGLDLKAPEGRDLFLQLVPHFDVVCENFKAGTAERLGIGYDDCAAVDPSVVYLSVSGFGHTIDTPYNHWPAYAGVAEAMSGIYEYSRRPNQRPIVNPMGGVGDIGTALFATVGVLAALRHKDRTGEGQYVDIAMYDAMVAITDIVSNLWSLEGRPEPAPREQASSVHILDTFEAGDGFFMMQVGREHQFERLAKIIGKEEWLDDPRFATRQGWASHCEDVIRPAVEGWAADKTRHEVCDALAAGGVAAGPCHTSVDLVGDVHVANRAMLVEIEGANLAEPALVPGNPVKLSKTADGPETRVPWVGEHTDEVLTTTLGMDDATIARLRDAGVIG